MIDIVTLKGEQYSFDPTTERVFKGGRLLSSTAVEPIYSNFSKNSLPIFSGLWLKGTNSILSLSGKISPATLDINSIQ